MQWHEFSPWASPVALVVKNLPAKAGDIRDTGLIPASGRSPRGGHGNPLQYSGLGSSWIEEPGRLRFIGLQSWTRLKWLSTAQQFSTWLIGWPARSLFSVLKIWNKFLLVKKISQLKNTEGSSPESGVTEETQTSPQKTLSFFCVMGMPSSW